MTRSPTHTGIDGSGQIALPPSHGFDAAERLVQNPVLKLMGGAVLGLCSLLMIVLLWSGNLKLSTIEGHLNTLAARQASTEHDIRELREWRAAQSAQGAVWDGYLKSLEEQSRQGAEMLGIFREIRDRLPPARK